MDNFEEVNNVFEDSKKQSTSKMSLESESSDSQSVTDTSFDSSLDLDIVVKVYSATCSSESEQENVLKLYQGPLASSTPNLSPQSSDQTNENIEIMDSHVVKESCINVMYANKCCLNNCIKVIPCDIAEKYRKTFQRYSEKDQELIIKAQLAYSRQDFKFLDYYNSKRTSKKETDIHQYKTLFYYRQIRICKKLYLFLHDLEYTKYEQIVAQFDECELASYT